MLNRKKMYCAKDLFTVIGKPWKGGSTLDKYGVDSEYDWLPVIVGKAKNASAVTHLFIDQEGVDKILNSVTTKVNLSNFVSAKPKDQTASKQVEKLEKTVDDLKVVLAQLVIKKNNDTSGLSFGTNSAKVKHDPIHAEARREVREICENYAASRAKDYGIEDSEKRRIFYDLTYKALYTKYKEVTQNHTDLQDLARQRTKIVGHKVSALEVAEQLGLTVELLQLARKIYNSN